MNPVTTRPQQTIPGRWALSFLAALVAVLTILSLAGTSSAVTGPTAKTRVGVHNHAVDVLVELQKPKTAGHRLGNDVPGPGIVVATGVAANAASKFGSLTHASAGIAPYSTQRLITAGQGGAIQAHHLVEKRFAAVMGQNTADMSAIVVTRAEHQVFTNAWRQAIPYGSRNVTPGMVNNAARTIYRDYPEILRALGLG
jgi:hypothetical protein